jgi:tRNA threonylcarbamoyladenosine biosynthesis protein TsaE
LFAAGFLNRNTLGRLPGMMNSSISETVTHSAEETFALAYSLGESLAGPTLLLLEGNLGAGKTVFAKGLICGLGHPDPDEIPSPSFTLVNEYDLRLKVYHIDLYRVEGAEDLRTLELEEIFGEPAVILVEWAEKLGKEFQSRAILVKIQDLGEENRRILISPT